jgi:transcriptional regulator of acetoin/glycerol metabolism
MAELRYDDGTTRRSKEELLRLGLLAPPTSEVAVPDVIQRSWRRCLSVAAPQTRIDVPYRDAVDRHAQLVAAARPVFDRIATHLAGTGVALFLSDNNGQIVLRQVEDRRHRDAYDNACAAEGFDFSENAIGTNGLGTVIEERRPVFVRGCEHFNEALEPLACAGVPIFRPYTRQVVGSFALACSSESANPLMFGMALDVGRQIEVGIASMQGDRERALAQAYLTANQARRDPVIVVSERSALANTVGLRDLSTESHAMLWNFLLAQGFDTPTRQTVPLAGGQREAIVHRVVGSGEDATYLLRLLPVRDLPRRARTVRQSGGPLHPVRAIDEQLRAAARSGRCVVLDGQPGTGKRTVARAILRGFHNAADPLMLDIASTSDWYEQGIAAAGRGLVLMHLQDLPPAQVNRVKSLASGSPLVVTVSLTDSPPHIVALVGQLATAVTLPGLRAISDRIPALAKEILAELPGRRTLSSSALQALLRWPWPGNIAELRRALEHAASRTRGNLVDVQHLPSAIRTSGSRQYSIIESAERAAIIDALQNSGGNRTQAAAQLGIGRTTLYRKLCTYRIS